MANGYDYGRVCISHSGDTIDLQLHLGHGKIGIMESPAQG